MRSCDGRPTDAELEILVVLWERGSSSVREVYRVLNESKPTGYTTVLKFLQILAVKGLVERDEASRPQRYRPVHSKRQTQRQLLKDLLRRAFGGSTKALVLQALSMKKVTPEEIKQVETFLDSIEEK